MDRQSSFESRLIPEPNSGCWLWFGMQRNGKAYGVFCWKNKSLSAHRAAWEIYFGPIPPGMNVCHKCDVPMCVNPEHLFIGTQLDNMTDCRKKGRNRAPIGEKQHLSKLSDDAVRNIRSDHDNFSLREMAEKFGVNKSTIDRVIKRRTWKHVQ